MFRNSVSVGAILGLSILLAACATQKNASVPASNDMASTPAFERQINPFVVKDANGRAYDFPFLGGLNVPRPQFVDIDQDGDDDLFLQEITGQMMFFERTGESTYRWNTDRFQNMNIGEWSRFYDMDQDGDYDLLTEQPFSYVRYYRNDSQGDDLVFTLLADTLIGSDGEPVFADRQNIPNLTDIDCDGLVDLFIGRVEGTVMRYEAVSKVTDEAPVFKLVSERFENIEIIGQIGSLHGANTLAFYDIDADGDQDLFWGDFFEPSLLLLENTGSCANPVFQVEPVSFPPHDPLSTSGYNAPAFSDLDADGDTDMFVGVLGGAFNPNFTSADNFYLLERDDASQYNLKSKRFLYGLDVGRESIPVFVDLDGDGDQDFILSNKIEQEDFDLGRSIYFENQGTAAEPSFQLTDTLGFATAYHHAPAFADLDADGDLDALVGTWSQGIAFYRNNGSSTTPKLEAENTSFLKLTRGSNATPALADIDADGDMDLFIGEASGTINFYLNEGSPTEPSFVLVSDEYLDIDVGRRSAPTLADMDGDGDFDMLIGKEAPGMLYFENTGTPSAPMFEEKDVPVAVTVPAISAPALVDIDADGDLDFFTGGDGGGVLFYQNNEK